VSAATKPPVLQLSVEGQGTAPAQARILIVDDDHAICRALGEMIVQLGHEPMTATTFTEALRLYRDGKPDLVLLDVMMPTLDGYKMAKLLRGESSSFVPIVLLTALDDMESKRRGMEAGADDFLTKPVTPMELRLRLSSLLRIKVLTDQLANANRQLAELAVTDPLTALPNRRYLFQELEREFQRARRYGHPLSVMLLDLDHFKQVNDTRGHPVGDRVLQLVGKVLSSSVRSTDLAGRVGGEEFMVIAPETGIDVVSIVAERIRQNIRRRSQAAGERLPTVTVSIGISTTEHPDAGSSEELVKQADEALYQAKRGGRDRVVVSRHTEG
jgi:diguanylate cyclase (GGDEF)-like protein